VEIIIIGSGTCVPSLRRASPGIVVDSGTHKFLLDSGPGTLRQMLQAGITINDIDTIIYSHFHVDHIADLVPFIFAAKYSPDARRTEDLTIMGPPGIGEFYRNLTQAYGRWIIPEHFTINWIESDNASITRGASLVRTAPTRHADGAMATRIELENGTSVVYSGDSEYCASLVEIARSADLLILECAFPEEMQSIGHLTPSLAGKIARESRCKKLLLTHFYPACDESDLLTPLRAEFDGEVILAEDLMRVRV
jgi:ribonuclease BN (tRNA processing enzyme)